MIKKITLMIFTLLLPISIWAASEPASQLQTALDSFQALSANFTQTMTGSDERELEKSEGTMVVHRPNKFRWQTDSPNRQLIVASGDKLWIYDVDLEQVTLQSLEQTTGSAPALLLSGDLPLIQQDFTITSLQQTAEKLSFKLTPKTQDSYFQWIEISFMVTERYPDKVLDSMVLMDNLGQLTKLRFSNVIKNPKLVATLFNFIPPDGVDVIEMQ